LQWVKNTVPDGVGTTLLQREMTSVEKGNAVSHMLQQTLSASSRHFFLLNHGDQKKSMPIQQ
jgi:hypothetical protein